MVIGYAPMRYNYCISHQFHNIDVLGVPIVRTQILYPWHVLEHREFKWDHE